MRLIMLEFYLSMIFDGYFVCSIGDASPETIKKYIDEQG